VLTAHLEEDLSVAALATRARFGERSFARAFRAEIGQTPAAYVKTLRVERSRTLLAFLVAGMTCDHVEHTKRMHSSSCAAT
jgi:transcriptional regulator GlxA family with amidase domain